MKFTPIGTDKTKSIKVNTKQGEVDFVPTFSEGDTVTIIPKYKTYSTEFEKMWKHKYKVNYCKVIELGDIIEEVVYLKECTTDSNVKITNPYLIKHFKLVE